MITKHPELFWGLVASMWIGNCFLLLLNLPLVRIWLSVFKIKYSSLFPAILFFCCIGTYSINNNLHDIYTTATFGVLGYIFLRFKLDPGAAHSGFHPRTDARGELQARDVDQPRKLRGVRDPADQRRPGRNGLPLLRVAAGLVLPRSAEAARHKMSRQAGGQQRRLGCQANIGVDQSMRAAHQFAL